MNIYTFFKTEKIHIALVSLTFLVIGTTGYLFYMQQQHLQTTAHSESVTNTLLKTTQLHVASLTKQIAALNSNITSIQSDATAKKVSDLQSQVDSINTAFTQYTSLSKFIDQAKKDGVSTDPYAKRLQDIASSLLALQTTTALQSESSLQTDVTNADNAAKYTPTPTPVATTPKQIANVAGSSYAVNTVSAQGNNYTVYTLTIDLTTPGLHIITDTADNNDCANNCTVTDLMSFYTKNHGFAAINGTYLCPASYSSCVGKTNSFDFPVYNTNLHKWINQGNLFWVDRAMMTFNTDNSVTFYPEASSYSLGTGVSAGIVMAPGLVQNGKVIVGNYPIDTKSSTAQITRGAMATKGNSLILAFASGATVPQMAYIMQAMGVNDAINIDGGGSTAMIYNGQYLLGPGRGIPDAIIFSKN